ncbi:MAG TPA: DUF1565 domain-containing protein, partial [Ferruginibacter sp.]|nr:DUF1565 domain-containing protein [Ferruginibacter sp.]HNN72610.1 DUF1565 domain-containing protein [Ferruginibacter sp.]
MGSRLPATKHLITVFLFIILSVSAEAATYYIDPNGNDVTGNGSLANPWKTLRKATLTVTGAGNIIHVNAGTYYETQECYLAVGVNLEGAGSTVTIIRGEITGQFSTLLSLDSPNDTNGNQSVSGITF